MVPIIESKQLTKNHEKLLYAVTVLFLTDLATTSYTENETTDEKTFQEINPSDDGNPKGPDPCDDGNC